MRRMKIGQLTTVKRFVKLVSNQDQAGKPDAELLRDIFDECDALYQRRKRFYIVDATNVYYPQLQDEFTEFDDLEYTCGYFGINYNIRRGTERKSERIAENVSQMKIRAFMQKYHKLTKTNKAVYKQLVRYLRLHPHQEEVDYIIQREKILRLVFNSRAKRQNHPPDFQFYLFYDKYSGFQTYEWEPTSFVSISK